MSVSIGFTRFMWNLFWHKSLILANNGGFPSPRPRTSDCSPELTVPSLFAFTFTQKDSDHRLNQYLTNTQTSQTQPSPVRSVRPQSRVMPWVSRKPRTWNPAGYLGLCLRCWWLAGHRVWVQLWASFTQAEIPMSLTAALFLLAFGQGQPNGVTAHFPPVRVVTSGQGVRTRGSCAEDHKPQSHSPGPCGCLAPEQ